MLFIPLKCQKAVKDGTTLEYTFFIDAGTTDNPAVANEEVVVGYHIDLRGEDISGS